MVAVHTDLDFDTAAAYVDENYKDSLIIFLKDSLLDPTDPYSDDRYYTTLGGSNGAYPITLILDANGVVSHVFMRDVKQEELENAVKEALAIPQK